MITVDLIQGTEEWLIEKLGKPSASNAAKIITTKGTRSTQRKDYLFTLASERVTGKVFESYKNDAMQEGNEREDESRTLYELIENVEVTKVGLVYKNGEKKFLCSPDGLINSAYGLELKNVIPKTQAEYLYNQKLPSAYFGQIQFSLYVTGFDYWHFMTYCPCMPHFLLKVERDEKYIAALAYELDMFCKDLDEITEKIK